MKIALAQMEVVPGRPKKNLETMLRMIDEAKQQHVDLIAFPEMCIGGYLVGDKWLDDSFCYNLMEFNEEIRKASQGIAVAYGNIFVDDDISKRFGDYSYHPNKDGRSRKYNAVYVYQNGQPAKRKKETNILPAGVQPKTLLPNYRFFDDERYFFSLEDVAKDFNVDLAELLQPFVLTIDGKEIPIGFEVCEDLWCEDYRQAGKALNPTEHLIDNGAQYIVNISSSPWTHGKNAARDHRIEFLKQDSGAKFVPFFYVNCIGAQNNGKNIVTFDGGSTVYNSEGKPAVLSAGAYHEELLVVQEEDLQKKSVARPDHKNIAEKCEAIVQGIRHVKDILSMKEDPKFLLGMSGGVDSSVVAALLTLAVGPEKVLGVNMPTTFNSDKTKRSAAYTAQKLGIPYLEIPVGELARHNEELLAGGPKLNAVQKGNIAAKVRGTAILSNLAAQHGALFTNNGNKLETALGYATLYGDVNGALAPIADLTKAEVFELARYLNQEKFYGEIIPQVLLPDQLYRFTEEQIQPSAELEEDQIDPMMFGFDDALITMMTDYKKVSAEDILQFYKDGILHRKISHALGREPLYGYALMKRWGLDDAKVFAEHLAWFDKTVQRNVFKRVQSPPIIITSKSSYGYDIRESMLPYETSLQFERLNTEILQGRKYTPQPEVNLP